MLRVHILRCWPSGFAAVLDGTKTYEVRVDDRAYAVGDFLRLDEFDPQGRALNWGTGWKSPADARTRMEGVFTGRSQWVRVVHKTPGGSFGLPLDLCALGIERCEEPTP